MPLFCKNAIIIFENIEMRAYGSYGSSYRFSDSKGYVHLLATMFEQAKSTLSHLLNYLTSMYSAHGISFNVNALFNTILRMLTPL